AGTGTDVTRQTRDIDDRAGHDVDGRAALVDLGGVREGAAGRGGLHAGAGLVPAGLLGGDVGEVHGQGALADVDAADAVVVQVDAGIAQAIALDAGVLLLGQRGGVAVGAVEDDGVDLEAGGHD